MISLFLSRISTDFFFFFANSFWGETYFLLIIDGGNTGFRKSDETRKYERVKISDQLVNN